MKREGQKRDTVREADALAFNNKATYFVYLAEDATGGRVIVLVDKGTRYEEEGNTFSVYAHEISRGTIVKRKIKQAELQDFLLLGWMTGHGANAFHQHGGNVMEFIDLYGGRPKKLSFWKRFLRKLGLSTRK